MAVAAEGIFTAICPFRPRGKEKAMKKYEKELVKYCDGIVNSEDYKIEDFKKHAVDWMFGAINFSFAADLIDAETSERLLGQYVFKE